MNRFSCSLHKEAVEKDSEQMLSNLAEGPTWKAHCQFLRAEDVRVRDHTYPGLWQDGCVPSKGTCTWPD